MVKRGRTSQPEREFKESFNLPSVTPIEITDRPSPPIDFDEREAAEWYEIVNTMPADWFSRASQAVLTQYVRHTIASQNLASLIADVTANTDEINVKTYITLLRAQKEESTVLASLATKLRITQQAVINKRGNAKDLKKAKPWE